METGATTSYEIAAGKADELVSKLNEFSDIKAEMKEISEQLEGINNHTLKPEKFYNGVHFDSNKLDEVTESTYGIIDKIKSYIVNMDKINSDVSGMDSIPDEADIHVSDILEVQKVVISSEKYGNSIFNTNDNDTLDDVTNSVESNDTSSIMSSDVSSLDQEINSNVADIALSMDTFEVPKNIDVKIGDVEATITSGTYKVNGIMYDMEGNVESIQIDGGQYSPWIHLDSSGNITGVDSLGNETNLGVK